MEMKLPFKVYVDGRSEEIQKHLFALGCDWGYGGLTVMNPSGPFLYVNADKKISCGINMQHFKMGPSPELTADEVLAIPIAKPAHQFKPFDRVLVRDEDTEVWVANLYSHEYDNERASVCMNTCWYQCIPYEGNEHLIGTSKSPA